MRVLVLRYTANVEIIEFEKNLDFFIYTDQINIEENFFNSKSKILFLVVGITSISFLQLINSFSHREV